MRYSPAFPAIRDTMISSIMFQIYYTLAVAQRTWTGFRHGDLLPHNIMVKLADGGEKFIEREHYLQYSLDDTVWNVPFYGFFVKIIDFGHSEIPEEGLLNSVKRAGDNWVPDHIAFIIHFEAIIQEAHFMTARLRKIFNVLNHAALNAQVSGIRLIQLANQFEAPEPALHRVFNAFETEVPQELIMQRYKCSI